MLATAPLSPALPPQPAAAAGNAPTATDAETDRFQRLLEKAKPHRHGADQRAAAHAATPPGPDTKTPRWVATPPEEDLPGDGPVPVTASAADTGAAAPANDATAMLATLQALATPRPVADKSAGRGDDLRPAAPRGPTLPASTAEPALAATAPPAPAAGAAAQTFAGTMQLQAELQAASEAAPRPAETPVHAAETPLPLPPALGAAPATPLAASAPAEARIAASPGSPDFPAQLGAQLSTFVREGVQHARLELHPVELGPVTVRIQLDGSQAQVNLSAERGDTRQALEQALPQLAGSLREAGLTLSGGGVFEQPRQAPGESPTRDGRRSGPEGRADEPLQPSPAPAVRRRGVVDLVA